ncbi:MAG: SRPBCC family protein [Pseudomonadota bacterium]
MKFSARENVAAPSGDVFAAITDFSRYEREGLRRGMEIERLDQLAVPGVGMRWRVAFDLRGRRRVAETKVTDFNPDRELSFVATVSGLMCTGRVEVAGLSKSKSRMNVSFDMKPNTLGARMMLQGLKLAKSSLSERFKARVARLARDIEKSAPRQG